jgi:hypothetical protein
MTHWTRIRSRTLFWTLSWAVIGFVLSSFLIYLFGDSGLTAYADLDSYRNRLAANVARLSSLNGDLSAEARLAENDPETIRVLARSVGLYAPKERVIRIRGYASSSAYEVGDLLRYRIGNDEKNRSFKILGISLPLAMAALSVFLRLFRDRKR